jgi:CheY-like chemotaxis protein
MKNIILIDDLSNKGWKSVLDKSVVKDAGQIHAYSTYDSALKAIATKADLIFLDVRLTEEDHSKSNICDFSGFQILQKIKGDFLYPNFSTPIILLTASNKIWVIEEFKQYGIDAFYIKEHPDFGLSKEYSRENLERLQSYFLSLIPKGEKRYEVWNESKEIINKLNTHKYFNESSGYVNVKNRIIDKLKLSYANLFSEQPQIEKLTLKADNESLAFIIYWSILEEIVKGFSEKDNWDKNNSYTFSGQWRFRNNKSFIQKDSNILTVNPFWDIDKNNYLEKKIELTGNEFSKYLKGYINLSEQIYALLFLFGINEKHVFKNLNEFRNEIDYIHSSIKTIYKEPLVSQENRQKTYENIRKTLKLINTILNYPE